MRKQATANVPFSYLKNLLFRITMTTGKFITVYKTLSQQKRSQRTFFKTKNKADFTVGNILSFNQYFGRHGINKKDETDVIQSLFLLFVIIYFSISNFFQSLLQRFLFSTFTCYHSIILQAISYFQIVTSHYM